MKPNKTKLDGLSHTTRLLWRPFPFLMQSMQRFDGKCIQDSY